MTTKCNKGNSLLKLVESRDLNECRVLGEVRRLIRVVK